MSDPTNVFLASLGMITSIGNGAEMTLAAVESGISAYGDSDYYNKKDRPMIAAWVPDKALPELIESLHSIPLKGDEKRLIRLCDAALKDARLRLPKANKNIPLFLAGPELFPSRPNPINENIIHFIQHQSGVKIDVANSRYFPTGRSGVIQAIEHAFEYFSISEENYAIVGGVDSYNNLGLVCHLDAEDRIKAVGVSDGFVLGEGAGFLLLSKKPHQAFLPVALSRPGLDEEKGHRYAEDDPYTGDGLANAVKTAVENSSGQLIDTLYTSMNGESFFTKEHGVMSIRNAKAFSENLLTEHPADCFGDIGAATGAVLVGLSALKLEKQKNQNPRQHLICCSSELAPRGAVCLSKLQVNA